MSITAVLSAAPAHVPALRFMNFEGQLEAGGLTNRFEQVHGVWVWVGVGGWGWGVGGVGVEGKGETMLPAVCRKGPSSWPAGRQAQSTVPAWACRPAGPSPALWLFPEHYRHASLRSPCSAPTSTSSPPRPTRTGSASSWETLQVRLRGGGGAAAGGQGWWARGGGAGPSSCRRRASPCLHGPRLTRFHPCPCPSCLPLVPAPSSAFLLLYANGKSAVRVDAPGVRQLGPHFFTGDPSPRCGPAAVTLLRASGWP